MSATTRYCYSCAKVREVTPSGAPWATYVCDGLVPLLKKPEVANAMLPVWVPALSPVVCGDEATFCDAYQEKLSESA